MIPLRKKSLGRRALLRGSVAGLGVAIGLPLLEAMLDQSGTALAHGEDIPTRFGVWFWGNGTILSDWIPAATGTGWTPSSILQPFADQGVQDAVRVLSGLRVPFDNSDVHDVGRAAVLSGTWDPAAPVAADYTGAPTAPSVDQVAAEHIAGPTPYRSLEVGVSEVGNGNGALDRLSVSWVDPISVLPAEFSPGNLFRRLFVDGFNTDERLRDTRLSMLDAIAEDAGDLSARLGQTDRIRLEAHLEGIRELDKKLNTPPPAGCRVPADPGDPVSATPAPEPLRLRAEAMADVLAVALACDLTRVFNFRYTAVRADTLFSNLGATVGLHPSTHDGNQQHIVSDTVQFTMAQFAYLLARLQELPEGDGTLLDHCLVMASSEVAEGADHGLEDIPFLLAGGGSGRLTPSAHHRFEGESVSRALLTALQGAGAAVGSIGAEEGVANETLPGLLV